ncbi:DUF4350 domain-containing protein [Candidatus Gracilibacteria bacterium]|nr:DUF4350 domain-containing protein [Candidatus Gracilibacteria bacterium]NJP21154.1 DUF4350 domain-containing protein [Hydrococcus sp. CRU_1_1]
MKITKRRLIIYIAIALVAIILITIIAAPNTNQINKGSTYGRAPDGYGAWYSFMSERGTPVRRWQKPFDKIIDKSSITFLRIYPKLMPQIFVISQSELNWVKKGNTIVILGVYDFVTEAPFSSEQDSSVGKIKIDTRRRKERTSGKLLGDRFGAIIWSETIGKGKIIYSTTPHLAANAYQDFHSNYEFLAQLVTEEKNPIWVDEYLHGYKDKDVIDEQIGGDIFSYLARTPLLPILIQSAIALIIVIWAGNRRFGKPVTIAASVVENSEAYIQALAGVLQKAKSSEFLVTAIAKEEQRQLQKALGLEETLLDSQSLVDAWIQQTGQNATELKSLLKVSSNNKPMSEVDLLAWIEKWQKIRQI